MVTKQATMNGLEKATKKLAKLKIAPRPRPKLHVKTTCPNCGTVLEWAHSLPRHMKTKKCMLLTKCGFVDST